MIPGTFAVARAVVMPVQEAAVLLALAKRYERTLARDGARLQGDVGMILAAMDLAIRDLTATGAPPDGGGRTSVGPVAPVRFSVNDMASTADAAAILGCTASNARDLARRGVLPGRSYGGRWYLDRVAVHARAEHRARQHAA